MMKQINKFTTTLVEQLLIVIWWTFFWSLWKENMVLLILIILHVMVIIWSSFLHIHTPFKQTWLFMVDLFLLVKFYVKELTYFRININYRYYYLQRTKYINAIVSLRKISNGSVNVIFYYSKDVLPPCLRSISHHCCNTFSPLYIPMK